MTKERLPSSPLGSTHRSSGFTASEAAVVRATFAFLRNGDLPTVSELARSSNVSPRGADLIIADFVRSGRAQIDDGGHVFGIAGLTAEPSKHRLSIEGVPLFTWCAFDAIGIPAALAVDAIAVTTCRGCAATIEIEMTRGRVPESAPHVGWLPLLDTCTNVRSEFCPEANLFCNEAHLETWRIAAGMPDGMAMDLESLNEFGRSPGCWGPLAP